MNTREYILRKANGCVNGARREDYGSPEKNFGMIAMLWSAYLDTEIKPVDVTMMMGLLKIARIKSGRTSDSFIDLAGYAACGGELAVKEKTVEPSEVDEESLNAVMEAFDPVGYAKIHKPERNISATDCGFEE